MHQFIKLSFISKEQTLTLKSLVHSDLTMKGAKSTKKADSKLTVKKTAAKGKAAKDPNKPKRPASAFFVFMEDFRKQYKEEHPDNKSVAAVGKAGGTKWKSMSESEKAPFVAKADKRKKEYEKNIDVYNKKLAGGANDEDDDSDKSKSEVNNEEDEEGSDEDEDDD
ncbi:unnamed protein product [Lactuca saligna]|uniref:HMG box domain-containing protein n=1 Tax=Lactuca saligna TaxID=75948 RepID=A0AA36EMY6_LACSI|nr:unnamed protein product [Lactuca saligna]